MIKVASGIYSLMSQDDLLRLKAAIDSAYPTKRHSDRRRDYVTLACQPTAAERFIENVNRINGVQI